MGNQGQKQKIILRDGPVYNSYNLLNTYFEFQSGLVMHNSLNAEAYLNFLTEETARFTASSASFFLNFDNKTKVLSILSKAFNDKKTQEGLTDKVICDISGSEAALSRMQKNDIYILNNYESILLTQNYNICILPVSINDDHLILAAVGGRICNYVEEEIVFLKKVLCATWHIYKNYKAYDGLKSTAREKDEYMMNVAHEMRTHVNAISGFSDLLPESENLTSAGSKYLKIILTSSEDLLAITNDFEEVVNLEANLARTKKSVVNIKNLVRGICDNFKAKAGERNIRIIDRTRESHEVFTDAAKLDYIISSVLSVSLRFTFSGNIEIECKSDGGKAEFRISDEGSGIPNEFQPNLFRYFSADEDTFLKRNLGAGVKLALSYDYVRYLGGDMWFSSDDVKGSTFFFNIPGERTNPDTINNNGEEKRTTKSILVAENDNNNYLLIKHYLEKFDIDLIRALNGEDALRICSTRNVDLVLMDMRIPVMDGFIAAMRILKLKPEQKIIAQTSFPEEREKILSCGCIDLIIKPFIRQQLTSLIDSYI